jgi:hypothetical protein
VVLVGGAAPNVDQAVPIASAITRELRAFAIAADAAVAGKVLPRSPRPLGRVRGEGADVEPGRCPWSSLTP